MIAFRVRAFQKYLFMVLISRQITDIEIGYLIMSMNTNELIFLLLFRLRYESIRIYDKQLLNTSNKHVTLGIISKRLSTETHNVFPFKNRQ